MQHLSIEIVFVAQIVRTNRAGLASDKESSARKKHVLVR